MERQQSTNTYPILFLMVSTSDGVTPVTGITPTVTVSKNGGSYASASSTVTEIANGVYSLSGAGLATDLNTLGTAAFHATGTGAHPREFMVDVVANNPFAATVVVGTNNDKTDYELTTTERAAIGAAFLATEITKGDPGTIERAFWQALKAQASVDGVISGTPTSSTFLTDLTADTHTYEHQILVLTSGSLAGQAQPIDSTSNTGTYLQITLQHPFVGTPAADDEFLILPEHVHTTAELVTAVWAAATRTLTAATNITSDGSAVSVTSGVVNHVALVDTTTTNTDMRGTNGANTTTPPTAGAIADAVWDEATAGHTTAGTYGKGFTDILGRVTAAVYTMWTDLIAMISGQKFTTSALSNSPSGSGGLTEANIDAIVTRVRGVTVRGDVPAASRKGFDRPFYAGDAYTGDRKALITITGWVGQDIADADSITLTADLSTNAATTFTWTADVADAVQTGSTLQLYFDLSSTDTDKTAGTYFCCVRVVWGSEVVTVLDPEATLVIKDTLD